MNSKLYIFILSISCVCLSVFSLPAIEEYEQQDDGPSSLPRASCELPMETGLCRARMLRWGYDAGIQDCVSFYYGGCSGNGNNFQTKEECLMVCKGVQV